ncbi:hypothetical protein [Variovorax sp. N23]|uniref:hypothetical protein n=1 Tax=Variovorax sp. N23 TaxID=2980555 RepID=UPI0021C63D3E|nr:hypothetical protein [Variovorax sp. N23]MCU4119747.1 hypothetical protein [Variovorax sp. N23]
MTNRTHAFRVIEGGASVKTPAAAPCSKSSMQKARLNQAILRLPVPETGVTVEEALQELSDKVDSEEEADFLRLRILQNQAEHLGLWFRLAVPQMNLVRECYFMLAWPERLVRVHPELRALYPESHPLMTVG